ncbi:MAG: acetate--CoA ligase [Candidatus Caldarchaeum sp.]|uniref:Acetate--CoA ligase n=1 Tax=Caldiarchaeum subterraneum TaxID=311458 RepID=A0A7C4E207_CALS0|nr:acetate--CoA ligase [Candidatus Caldarchaeales archaeon]
MSEALPFDEYLELPNWRARTVDIEAYKRFWRTTVEDFVGFWEKEARNLEWFRPWDRVLESGEHPFVFKWFVGGLLNISYLCLDRHAKSWRRNKVAYIWEGEPVDGDGRPLSTRKYTYYELYREVNRLAHVFLSLGLRKGDRAAIYLPMIPELPITMLALARIGVIFTVVFSGFSAENLAIRVNDLGAKVLVTADGFYRRGRLINLKEVVDKAVESTDVEKVVVVKRAGNEVSMKEGRDFWLHDLLRTVPENVSVEPEPLDSTHPLYVLYTSGTTGKPKGIIHDTGGYAVLLNSTMKWVFDIRDDDVYFCTADIGWVTGHSYIVFGPLMAGATIVMYEGTPDYPTVERWWQIIERNGVTIFYTTPTAVRMLMRFGNEPVQKHNRSTLRIIHSVGEPINPAAWKWLFEVVGERRCPVGSTWWMTETGGILISHLPGLMLTPLKPGTNGLPLPGIDAEVVDEKGVVAAPGQRGYLVIRKPWPGMLGPPTGMWKEPERYRQVYWEKVNGVFFTGDYAVKDVDGYIWVAGRADEVLKVAGHRIGTYELESVLVSHAAVSEAAVVGVPDEIKGETPVAFVVLKSGYQGGNETAEQLIKYVRETYGAIATPSSILFVSKLPKTRSGKIMRRVLRAVATGGSLGDLTTLEDEAAVDEVKESYEQLLKEVRRGR